jgi:hypothetical protein
VEKSEGFTRKNEDGREADFRLANRRLHASMSGSYGRAVVIIRRKRTGDDPRK